VAIVTSDNATVFVAGSSGIGRLSLPALDALGGVAALAAP
jgi:hypothetical protein